MSKNIIQFVVIILALLIIVCFGALIFGFYLKISGNQNYFENINKEYSINLHENEKILEIQVLSNSKLLFVVSNSVHKYAIVYDTNKNVIVSIIKR